MLPSALPFFAAGIVQLGKGDAAQIASSNEIIATIMPGVGVRCQDGVWNDLVVRVI